MTSFPPHHLLAAAAGGALGASLRYLFVTMAIGGAWGIFCLNIAGSLALGALFAWEGRAEWLTVFAGAGVLGALTTYSTFSADIVRLGQTAPLQAAGYIAASIIFGVGAFILGGFIVRSVS